MSSKRTKNPIAEKQARPNWRAWRTEATFVAAVLALCLTWLAGITLRAPVRPGLFLGDWVLSALR